MWALPWNRTHYSCSFLLQRSKKLFWKFVEEIIRSNILRNYEFKPFHVVYNCRDTIQETNSIDLFMNYALFSIYKASFTQNRITKNIVIKHLSHLLRSRLDIEKNRICKRGINVKEWKDICLLCIIDCCYDWILFQFVTILMLHLLTFDWNKEDQKWYLKKKKKFVYLLFHVYIVV